MFCILSGNFIWVWCCVFLVCLGGFLGYIFCGFGYGVLVFQLVIVNMLTVFQGWCMVIGDDYKGFSCGFYFVFQCFLVVRDLSVIDSDSGYILNKEVIVCIVDYCWEVGGWGEGYRWFLGRKLQFFVFFNVWGVQKEGIFFFIY